MFRTLSISLSLLAAACCLAAPRHPANRLAKETSPYLLQHAHNPVDWYPWGPEAFAKAKKEQKPIFLSIGYSSCHWCHVMERESFENEAIAAQLNERFVSIKVDREERPDIDDVYMIAVQAINDGRAGWPMSVFLTPNAQPFFGGTYYKPDALADLLRTVHEHWSQPAQRAKLEAQAGRLALLIGGLSLEPRIGTAITPATLTGASKTLLSGLDEEDGGFGGAPKFPPAVRLLVLLAEHRKKPDPQALKAVTLTLDRIARGGLCDQIGGGFHRYTVDKKWLVPHFEKMLYDNALLAWAYLEAHQATGNPEHRRVAGETLDFVLRELRDSAGGFHSALDADSLDAEGKRHEGLFYVWAPAEVTAALGKADGALFSRVFDITGAGNFEGKNIPNLLARSVAERAKELKTTPEALQARLGGMRRKLLAARGKRIRPSLDDKVLANWNGLMIHALALGYDVTGEARYRQAAEQAAAFILKSMRKEGRLLHSFRAGRTQPQAFLEDYAFLLHGLLELHRVTGQEAWLRESEQVAGAMVADFWDEGSASFYSTPSQGEVVLARLRSGEDNATPSGTAMAALSLIRLARLTAKPDLRAKAQRTLETYGTDMKRTPQAIAGLVLAAHTLLAADTAAVAQKKDPVTAVLQGVPAVVKAGQTFDVRVQLTIAPTFHINSDKPDDEFLIPTKAEPAGGPFKLVSAVYPKPKVAKLSISEKPAKIYEGSPVIILKLKAQPGAEKATELRVKLRYQACDDDVCYPPKDLTVTGKIGK